MSNHISAFLYCRGIVSEDMEFNKIHEISDKVKDSLEYLNNNLNNITEDNTEQEIQQIFYDTGKVHFSNDLRWWFKILYQVLLKQDDGPRLGQFTKIVSVDFIQNKTQDLLNGNWIYT